MNKCKQLDTHKKIVRNTELWQARKVNDVGVSSSRFLQKTEITPDVHTKSAYNKEFHTPEMQSTLKISKSVDSVTKPRNTLGVSAVNKNELASEEKVSKKVNFPYGQFVFKDLIPLCSEGTKSVPLIVNRGPVLQKDPEPKLNNFIDNEVKEGNKQFYLARSPKESCNKFVSVTKPLHLYQILQISDSG
ncbi:hypothetical protein GWI33_021319 [Rhynchophorus ferrugineus]|uniref:Uncharacterized protein n=1 Tax=Rhynchophorus ferrugineus TaxID=354439 RepID=A0A834HP81_RHYFE|nr:hypothetical protein GWI33_021319 [Rhynchophorus ferrugineus]